MNLNSLIRLLPKGLKNQIRDRIRLLFQDNDLLVGSSTNYIAYRDANRRSFLDSGDQTGPIPPPHLQAGYGNYLEGGRKDVDAMLQILAESGLTLSSVRKILEFGCAAGRMSRHIPALIPNSEFWGVDISVDHIRWCQENLMPPINFATTTTVPHLPFPDNYFDLVFCGSVFTHIAHLESAWMLEIGRILAPSGMLYLTVHDENTVKVLEAEYPDLWLTKAVMQDPMYAQHRDEFGSIVLGSGRSSQVFYNSEYFKSIIPPMFRCISYNKQAYGYQSAFVLQRV